MTVTLPAIGGLGVFLGVVTLLGVILLIRFVVRIVQG